MNITMTKYFNSRLCLSLFLLFFMIHCSNSKKSNKQGSSLKSGDISEPAPAPSPGTARVLATIVSIDSSLKKTVITLNIKKIQGYGAGTPLLSEQTEITAMISNTNFKRYNDYLHQEKPLKVTLSSMRNKTLKGQENRKNYWLLSSIQKPE